MPRVNLNPFRLYYAEDRIPITIFFCIFLVDLALCLLVRDLIVLTVFSLLTLFPKVNICAWNHHYQHLPPFRGTLANRFLDLVMFLQTGVSSHTWVLHHNLGHHRNYLDQTKDESAWKDRKGRTMGVKKYTLVVAGTAYFKAFRVGLSHPKEMRTFLGMGLISFAVLGGLFYHNPAGAVILFIIPGVIGLTMTAFMTYYHHSGLDTADHDAASYNITDPLFNWCTGNLGYHTAHHLKMGLHWSKLPALHQRIKHRIPRHNHRRPAWAYQKLRPLYKRYLVKPRLVTT